MIQAFFVTGIGTGIGKTLVSAILAEALQADYWKPIQAGLESGTDSEWVRSVLSNERSVVYPETYKFNLPASPHIAAKNEDRAISLEKIFSVYSQIATQSQRLVIEGAGGLMVPLNEYEFVADLVKKLNVKVIMVSRNFLGSINHSLLTAMACRQKNLRVAGWIFNDDYLNYENEITRWSGYPHIASIGKLGQIDKAVIKEKADELKSKISVLLRSQNSI